MSISSNANSAITSTGTTSEHIPGEPLPGGLVYVSCHTPGLSRVRSGEKFTYQRADGRALTDAAEIDRIARLAIPPAYRDVWICQLPNGHLQATGRDARGRLQYRYHADWQRVRDESKFERILEFGQALPRIRSRVAHDLKPQRGQPLARSVVLATLVRLLDTTYIRVGNDEYAVANHSYGLTTLKSRHAKVRQSTLTLHFRGKSGVEQNAALDDPRVARVVRRCQQLPGQELFQYEDDDGGRHSIGSADVNDYLREISQPRLKTGSTEVADDSEEHFTAKDFRTWHGTAQALELTRLACNQPPGTEQRMATAKSILIEVARQLGNTPAVCKKSYVHPAVLELGSRLSSDAGPDMQRIWERIGGAATPRGLSAAERRLLAFLRTPPKPAKLAKSAKKMVRKRGGKPSRILCVA